jgi:predicted acyl esterase
VSRSPFVGAIASEQVLTNGWLRLSRRKTDPARSLPWRPWHTHAEILPAEPGHIYPVDVEIWPTGIHLPAGYALALTIGGHDYTRPDPHPAAATLFLHTDSQDRPAALQNATISPHVGPAHDNTLMVPTASGLTR